MNYFDNLAASIKKNNSLLCIGLDPVIDKMPQSVRESSHPLYEFSRRIIQITSDIVCAYKPNIAFFEAFGSEGIDQLKKACDFLHSSHPEIPIILDAKRGDIESTNLGYVKFAFDWLEADAITLHPYLGRSALEPFLSNEDKGMYILCKTTNLGSTEFQNLEVDGEKLYEIVAKNVSMLWNEHKNCGLVVGATFPQELESARELASDLPFLIPGVGAQGGDLRTAVQMGCKDNLGIINASRSIIYASNEENFTTKVRQEALKLRDEINKYRA